MLSFFFILNVFISGLQLQSAGPNHLTFHSPASSTQYIKPI